MNDNKQILSKEFELMIILLCVLSEDDIESRLNMLHMCFFKGQQYKIFKYDRKILDVNVAKFF